MSFRNGQALLQVEGRTERMTFGIGVNFGQSKGEWESGILGWTGAWKVDGRLGPRNFGMDNRFGKSIGEGAVREFWEDRHIYS